MERISGRLTMAEGRRLSSILARVHKRAPVPTKKTVREAVKKEIASVLGDRPYWKRRLTKLAYAALCLNKAKKVVPPVKRRMRTKVSPALLIGAWNHERELMKEVPEHDR